MGSDEATAGPNAGQEAFWNAQGGRTWVELEALLEAGMQPVTDRLLAVAAPAAGEAVLDVGCGSGGTTLALAALVGPAGRAVGVDISAPLVERARARVAPEFAGRVEFRRADAQTAALEAGSYDLMLSRFGVMFFEDPAAAFRNLGQALRPGGRVAFAAWAAIEANPWFMILREAAEARLGRGAPPVPGAPGPFGFADSGRVLGLLAAAGLADAAVQSETLPLRQAATPEEAGRMALRMGPSAALMRERDGTPEDGAAIAAAVATRLAAYAGPEGVRVPGKVHFFTAVRPG